ncbi:predicted protein [Verticillium alfalfae VaMs.102]|uniref:Predicted protein n=1 Tax=Verticillium alfalfae (strain VaMs.102 / ATCC MYA-4576 / FGSC 10136) TaxID=526221 RepID=C9SB93_VERA1|nr:predicted protein [Verticillium alfalfae VaMs.102]EEY15643.1 predicted protein [Verticillium alfalfae VaMs.102]
MPLTPLKNRLVTYGIDGPGKSPSSNASCRSRSSSTSSTSARTSPSRAAARCWAASSPAARPSSAPSSPPSPRPGTPATASTPAAPSASTGSRSLTAAERARCRAIEEGLHPGNPAFQSALGGGGWADAATFLEAQTQWARCFAAGRPAPAPRLAFADDDAGDADAKWPTPLYRDVHPHMRIPDILLAGPWSPQDALLLRWLRRGGARFHASQSWELKLHGLRAAVQAPPPPLSSPASASSSFAFRHDAALIHALCCEGDFLWDREDKTPRFSPATSKTASGDEPDAGNNHAITDEWPRAVLAEELDRVYDVCEAWRRARGRREPDILVRLCHLFETALGEHLAPGEQLDLQALTRL